MDSLKKQKQILALSRIVDQWAAENLGTEPDWAPLRAAISIQWCDGFMWMNRVVVNRVTIELYKHGITRRYLNLDANGIAYKWTGDDYVATPMEEAIDYAFEGLEEMGWDRTTPYDEEFRRRKYQSLLQEGWTVMTTSSTDPIGIDNPGQAPSSTH